MTRLDDKDFYHGAALMQIVNHDQFTALNEGRYPFIDGYYWINHNTLLYLKYASNVPKSSPVIVEREDRKRPQSWSFSFTSANVDTFVTAESTAKRLFFAGVCGSTGVCMLTSDELLTKVIDLHLGASQTFEVTRKPGGPFKLESLTRPMSDFPKVIFT